MITKRISYRVITVMMVLMACGIQHCGTTTVAGGGSEETNARVMGAIVDAQGEGVPGVQVTLVPAGRDPVADSAITLHTDTTGTDGTYLFHADTGTYNIQAVHLTKRTRAFIPRIAALDTHIVDAGTRMLRLPGTILIDLPSVATSSGTYAYIIGTGISTPVTPGSTQVLLDSVPAGTTPAIYLSPAVLGDNPVKLADSAVVPENARIRVPFAGWAFSRRIVINTSATGANVTQTITGFPLLIRLNTGDSIFGQAQDSGRDIGFATPRGDKLPFQIEQWDQRVGTAAIWVRMDTVRGNNATQSIIMYWGASSPVSSSSDGTTVFDTADGFAGVWQMSGGATVAGVPDQTGRRNDGVAVGTWGSASQMQGIIGGALFFNGTDNAVVCATNTARIGTGSATMSAWVFTSNTATQPVLSYQNNQTRLRMAMQTRTWFGLLPGASPWLSSPQKAPYLTPLIADSQWHQMTAVYDRSGIARLYVDGTLGDTLDISAASGIDMSADSLVIGYDDFLPGYFSGMIDDVRLETRVRDPAWVRLCFENQRVDQKTVTFH